MFFGGIITDVLLKYNLREEFTMASVDKNTIIADVLKIDAGTAPFFFEIGMHCLGCPSASGESIDEACAVHGVDADELVNKINDYLKTK